MIANSRWAPLGGARLGSCCWHLPRVEGWLRATPAAGGERVARPRVAGLLRESRGSTFDDVLGPHHRPTDDGVIRGWIRHLADVHTGDARAGAVARPPARPQNRDAGAPRPARSCWETGPSGRRGPCCPRCPCCGRGSAGISSSGRRRRGRRAGGVLQVGRQPWRAGSGRRARTRDLRRHSLSHGWRSWASQSGRVLQHAPRRRAPTGW